QSEVDQTHILVVGVKQLGLSFVQNPSIDDRQVEAPVEYSHVPLFSLFVDSVEGHQHVKQVHTAHELIVYADDIGTRDVDLLLRLLVPSLNSSGWIDGCESRRQLDSGVVLPSNHDNI